MFARLSLNVSIPWRRLIKNFEEDDTEMGDGSDSDVGDTSPSHAVLPTRHDSMAELIPDFRPLWIPPFDITASHPPSSAPRTTPRTPVIPAQTTSSRHGRPIRRPWTVISEIVGQEVVLNSSHTIRQEAPIPRPAELDTWPLPTIEETARELLESGQYAHGNVALPSAYEEATDRPLFAPSQENRLNSQHSFTEYIYEGQTHRAEDDMYDPPPAYQASDPNNVTNFVPNAVPNFFPAFVSNFTLNPAPSTTLDCGPSFAHNTAFDDAFDTAFGTAPGSPMDTASDVAMQTALNTAFNTGTNTLHTREYPNITRSPRVARQPSSRVATGRIGKSMARCVEGIGKTAKDVPKVMKDMRQQHRVRRAKAKMSWLERHAFLARDGSLMYEAGM